MEPAVEFDTAEQLEQVVSAGAPRNDEYLPAPHSVHNPVPVVVLYVPAIQLVHETPFVAAVYPALQIQLTSVAEPAAEDVWEGQLKQVELLTACVLVEYLPVPQFVQSPGPKASLYLPAVHAVQAVPFTVAVYPWIQPQFKSALLPEFEVVNEGQFVHEVVTNDPNTVPYCPVLHRVQARSPKLTL